MDRRDDVDDVVSEVYASVWRRLDDALGADVPIAWIYGIAYRTISNQRRGGARALRLVAQVARHLQPRVGEDPGQLVAASEGATELEALVQRALDSLAPLDRELIRLSVWEELSQTDIAEVVGLTPASVRTRLYRARRRLQRLLKARDIPAVPDTSKTDIRQPSRASRRSEGLWL